MCKCFHTKLIYTLLALFSGLNCSRPDADHPEQSSRGSLDQGTFQPQSLLYFQLAEQQLGEGRYNYAATHLNKGIVAFRVETGKMSGKRAIRANRAIDELTRLRKNLRQGQSVPVLELHLAILSAMESEQIIIPARPKNGPEYIIPVGGN